MLNNVSLPDEMQAEEAERVFALKWDLQAALQRELDSNGTGNDNTNHYFAAAKIIIITVDIGIDHLSDDRDPEQSKRAIQTSAANIRHIIAPNIAQQQRIQGNDPSSVPVDDSRTSESSHSALGVSARSRHTAAVEQRLDQSGSSASDTKKGRKKPSRGRHGLLKETQARDVLDKLIKSCVRRKLRPVAEARILGVEMWPPSKDALQKLSYVLRITLSDQLFRQYSVSSTSVSLDELTPFECMGLTVGRRVEVSTFSSRVVFTIRRDLAALVALHSELDRLFKTYSNPNRKVWKDIRVPVFPDPFNIGKHTQRIGLSLLELRTI